MTRAKQPMSSVTPPKRNLAGAAAQAAAGVRVGGRPKGTPNKLTTDVRRLVLGALDELGGQKWLIQQARKHPVAFLSLISRCMPVAINGDLTFHHENLAERLQGVRQRAHFATVIHKELGLKQVDE